MCAVNQEKENMFAGAQHIDSHTASAVVGVQGSTLLQNSGTPSSDWELARTAFRILMDCVKWLKVVNLKRNAQCFRN